MAGRPSEAGRLDMLTGRLSSCEQGQHDSQFYSHRDMPAEVRQGILNKSRSIHCTSSEISLRAVRSMLSGRKRYAHYYFLKLLRPLLELTTIQVVPDPGSSSWQLVLPRVKLGPNKKHFFQLDTPKEHAFSHVKITILPGTCMDFRFGP